MGEKNKTYYLNFDTQIFLGAKELLKSMPTLYNRIYFSSKYANALWSGDKQEEFSNVTILTESENMETLRQIIKNNALYIGEWDSKRYTNGKDYGLSFIGGNIKYILLAFEETNDGYIVRSYDADAGDCCETTITSDKKFFLDTSIKENGEIVKTCDFNLEDMNDSNTKKERAPLKGPTLVSYNTTSISNKTGSIAINMVIIILISIAGIMTVYTTYNLLILGIIK